MSTCVLQVTHRNVPAGFPPIPKDARASQPVAPGPAPRQPGAAASVPRQPGAGTSAAVMAGSAAAATGSQQQGPPKKLPRQSTS